MIRLAFILYGTFVIALLVLGWFGDRSLKEQARAAEQEAISEIDETARMTAQAVRASLAQAEQAFLIEQPWSEMVTGRLAKPSPPTAPPSPFVPYLQRSETELAELLSSTNLTPSGLPEAVVAAIALGSSETRAQTASQMLNGRLPISPKDIDYLSAVLKIEDDYRCELLQKRLARAPSTASLPVAPDFGRRLTDRKTVEGWTNNEGQLWVYEIPAYLLLRSAGAAESAFLSGDDLPANHDLIAKTVSVPDVDQLTLVVTPEIPGQLRIRTLRLLLWAAVLASALGASVVLYSLRTQTRALVREKAFLANVTHELRTPLSSIRLFGETLAEGRGDPQEYGSLVAQESERLEALVERVLTATRVSEQTVFTQLDPVDLIQSAINLILDRAKRSSVQLSTDISVQKGSIPTVQWDGDSVRQAILNLLDNAIKYGKPGGKLDVGVTLDDGWVKVSVSDDGPGIGRSTRGKVFGRFYRGDTEEAGAGLGLYVVEQIAWAHGGKVELDTEEGRGSTFTLILPIEPPQLQEFPG